MKKYLRVFETELEDKELSSSTVNNYLRSVNRFIGWLGKREVNKKLVQEYRHTLEQQGYKASTINLNLIAVNKFLHFCGKEECTVKVERIRKRQSLNYVLEMEDYHKMLEYAKESGRDKYYMIMKTLAKTGIRISELRFITVETLDEGIIQVHNKGRYREIYLPDGLIRELYQYCKKSGINNGIIFVGSNNTAISRGAVWKMFQSMADMVGVDKRKAHPHAFRHFFCISYMNQYGNIFELADILGHASVETTRIYSKSTADQKRKRLDSLTD